jgi:hypothetical protein
MVHNAAPIVLATSRKSNVRNGPPDDPVGQKMSDRLENIDLRNKAKEAALRMSQRNVSTLMAIFDDDPCSR